MGTTTTQITKGTHVNGRTVASGDARNTKMEVGYHPGESIDQWEILQCLSLNGLTRVMTLADASVAGTATGQLYIAVHGAEADSSRSTAPIARAHPGPIIVGPVDTSAASAAGSPVYLSDTAGAISFTAGTLTRVIGHVVVDDATNGYWEFSGFPGTTVPAV